MIQKLKKQTEKYISGTLIPLFFIPAAIGMACGTKAGITFLSASSAAWCLSIFFFIMLSFSFYRSPTLFIGTYTSTVIFKLFLLTFFFLFLSKHSFPHTSIFLITFFMNLVASTLFSAYFLSFQERQFV